MMLMYENRFDYKLHKNNNNNKGFDR